METPSIGRIVIYRTKGGGQSLPAIITGTQETHVPGVLSLSSPSHVHLHVFEPSLDSPVGVAPDVPYDEDFGPIAGANESQAPATWRWPVRI